METKDRLNIYIPVRMKRRLKQVAEDKDMKMNDLVVTAIADMLDRMDMVNSSPDIVLDRLSQVLNSQMAMTTNITTLIDKVDEIREDLDT